MNKKQTYFNIHAKNEHQVVA